MIIPYTQTVLELMKQKSYCEKKKKLFGKKNTQSSVYDTNQ